MPSVDPIWVKLMIALIPVGYALGTALTIVLWRLNTSLLRVRMDHSSTRKVLKGLIQSHSKRHGGECGELLSWLSPNATSLE